MCYGALLEMIGLLLTLAFDLASYFCINWLPDDGHLVKFEFAV